MKYLRNMSVFQKIIFIAVLIVLIFTALLAFWVYPVFKNNMYLAKQEQTKNLVATAYSAVEHYVALQKSGDMTLEEAQAAAKDAVKYLQYGDGNYFWINDLEPKMIMHPNYSATEKPEWYAENGLTNYADPTGKKIFVEMAAIAKKDGEGYVNYEWTKPSDSTQKSYPKISFVKLVPEWGWVVGTGVYVDDVENEINRVLYTSFLLIGAIILVTILLSIFYARSISAPLVKITKVANLLAEGEISSELNMDRKDEVGLLATSFDKIIAYQREAANVADMIASGDFTAEIRVKSENDLLGNSFSKMLVSFREAMSKVAENAFALDSAAGQLSQAAVQAANATEQIATTIQQIANGTTEQAGAISKTANAVSQMSEAINGVAQGAQEQSTSVITVSGATDEIDKAIQQVAGNAAAVTKDSDKAAEAARKGSVTIENTLSGMNSIKQKVGASAEKVEEMGRRSEEIGKIVETIEDIASQTNLLALNAAIEAARAGDAGKGFAVVADEVRKLAERSSLATKEISDLVNRILSSVSDAVKAMQEGSKEVEKGVANASHAGSVLNDILSAAEEVHRQAALAGEASENMQVVSRELVTAVNSVSAIVEENTAATEEMAASSSEVNTAIESIASISEENSAAVEQVSAGAEQMSAQVEEVTAAAQQLEDMAKSLKSVVSQFKFAN